MAGAVLDERHHTFLQALMRRGPLLERESKSMYRELFGTSDDQFFGFLATVNRELDYLSMEVRGSTNQYNGKLYYGLVNKLANEEAKLGTRLTHPQLTFFKAILESILGDSSASGSISSMQALNLRLDTQTETQTQAEASSSQAVPLKLTLAAKEETLATLVTDNWLGRTEDGKVCLGTKSFLELRSLFKNFDVPFCEVCNEAAIKAQPCQNEDCNVRMHSYCVPRKFARPQAARVCPGCSSPWRMLSADGDAANTSDQEIPGNEVDDEDEIAIAPAPAARPRVRRAGQRRMRAKLESSSDDENGSNAQQDPSQETRATRKRRAKRGGRWSEVSELEELQDEVDNFFREERASRKKQAKRPRYSREFTEQRELEHLKDLLDDFNTEVRLLRDRFRRPW